MAGIAAVFKGKGTTPNDMKTLHSMMKKTTHRGSDDVQFLGSDHVLISVGILRNEAKQNHIWKSPDGTEAVVCDGRVLGPNMDRLDGERVARICEKCDLDALNSLNGAFAIAGFNEGNLYIARDFLGMKPLYQGRNNGDLYLSSELKGIPAFVDRIDLFPPGHFYSKDSGLRRYFDFSEASEQPQSVETLTKRVSRNLEKAVTTALRLNAKRKNIGALLSGGVDSSIITAILSRKLPDLHTFTVGTPGSEDLGYARKAAEFLGTNHHEATYTPEEIIAVLDDVVYHLESYEYATVRSAVANYFAAKEAAKYTSAVFIGEGGDENYGGYHHLKADRQSLNEELINLLESLHNIGCQRVDRMNMRFSLQVYAPFLNKDLVVLPSLRIPPNFKIFGSSKVEKWILRKSFENYLPEKLIWRSKKQFARGAGFESILRRFIGDLISDEQFEDEVRRIPGHAVRTKEELFYFRIFKKRFPHPDAPKTVGRWDE